MLMCMYFVFMHFHGGRLYIHTKTGHVLWLVFWFPNGFMPSILAPSMMFLGSYAANPYTALNALHWLASARCLSFGSSPSSGFFLSACQRMSFASLGSMKIPLQTGSDRKVPYNFLRSFLSCLLVSRSIAHWTTGFFRVLPPINDAIVDACMVPNVRQIKRANEFLGLLDTSRTQVPPGT